MTQEKNITEALKYIKEIISDSILEDHKKQEAISDLESLTGEKKSELKNKKIEDVGEILINGNLYLESESKSSFLNEFKYKLVKRKEKDKYKRIFVVLIVSLIWKFLSVEKNDFQLFMGADIIFTILLSSFEIHINKIDMKYIITKLKDFNERKKKVPITPNLEEVLYGALSVVKISDIALPTMLVLSNVFMPLFVFSECCIKFDLTSNDITTNLNQQINISFTNNQEPKKYNLYKKLTLDGEISILAENIPKKLFISPDISINYIKGILGERYKYEITDKSKLKGKLWIIKISINSIY